MINIIIYFIIIAVIAVISFTAYQLYGRVKQSELTIEELKRKLKQEKILHYENSWRYRHEKFYYEIELPFDNWYKNSVNLSAEKAMVANQIKDMISQYKSKGIDINWTTNGKPRKFTLDDVIGVGYAKIVNDIYPFIL